MSLSVVVALVGLQLTVMTLVGAWAWRARGTLDRIENKIEMLKADLEKHLSYHDFSPELRRRSRRQN